MKKIFYFFLIVLLNLGSSSAQIFKSKVNPFPDRSIKSLNSADTLYILAVLVEFQEDRYDATIGNGKFGSVYTQAYGDTIIDPLPHDADYFSDHLEFAQNYFRKVSNGIVEISFDIIPTVFTLSKPMRDYSPPYNSDDLSALGVLSEETWQLVDQSGVEVDFSQYDVFMIFHPGVSRGLDFGTYFLDRNLPSVYLSRIALQNVFGNDFIGFPVNDGNSFVTNSIILPETESRELEAIDRSTVLLQLTINGLIVANIASYLGLPDLFNTETGLSVIGRFGLMDGQSIFANSGMFPPEPSPWEKIYLGWETPVTLPPETTSIDISTRLTASPEDLTLVKIPINASEYFLIENRAQDANNDNTTVTTKLNGELIQKTFYPDEDGYFFIDPDSLRGVVVDVDEYDVSIPGNGIVVWHIDERVINERLPENKINVDEFSRGVDIEEADGIQDIGVQISTIFGTVINDGSYEDFWYSSNTAYLYENKFSSDTKPNTNTNRDASSLITLENYSDVGNIMSFDIKFYSEDAELISKHDLGFVYELNSLSSLDNDLPSQFLFLSGTTLYWQDEFGNIVNQFDDFSEFKPAAFSQTGTEYIVGINGSVINLFVSDMFGSNIHIQDIGAIITAPPVLRFNSMNELELLIGTIDGSVTIANVASIINDEPVNFIPTEMSSLESVKQICADEDYYCQLTENTFSDINEVITRFDYPVVDAVFTKDLNGNYITVVLTEQNRFYIMQNSSIIDEFSFGTDSIIRSFVIVDLFKNGQNYIVFANGNELYAVNFKGKTADNYPISDPENIGFDKDILISDLNLDGYPELFVNTLDGRIFAIRGNTARHMQPFPLSNGAPIKNMIITKFVDPASSLANDFYTYLSLVDEDNIFTSWKVGGSQTELIWTQELGSGMNRSFVPAADDENAIIEFFPKDKAYNWPNPVYGNETYIRYFVSEDSDIRIRIFDLAGDLVAQLNDNAPGGFDHETAWNVSNVESGVYFAQLQVTGASGVADFKIIKIAIIK
ncbi:T9SS type A sorting domain-containing protein [Bacteroidota bacterium]